MSSFPGRTPRGERLRFRFAGVASSEEASEAAWTGFFLISSVRFRASMMSITGAICGSGASTTFWP